jgi:hypothetical protein
MFCSIVCRTPISWSVNKTSLIPAIERIIPIKPHPAPSSIVDSISFNYMLSNKYSHNSVAAGHM